MKKIEKKVGIIYDDLEQAFQSKINRKDIRTDEEARTYLPALYGR